MDVQAARNSQAPDAATAAPTPGPAPWPGHGLPSLRRLLDERYALILAWAVMIVVFCVLRPNSFATTANLRTILSSQGVLLVASLAVVFPLVVGELDLSVGATLGFSAVMTAILNVKYHWSWLLCVAIAIAIGIVIGLVNGFFVVMVGVDGLITTLGIGTLVTGLGYAVTNYATVSGVDPRFVNIVTYQWLNLPISFYCAVALTLAIWYFFRWRVTGRHFVFVGQAVEVARLSGLRVNAIRIGAFVACAALASFAGLLLAGTLGGADPNAGASFLLPAYSAAFLGSTAILPGQFNPWGTLISVYFLITGITGLQLLGLNDWIQQVFYGLVLVLAVSFSRLVRRRTART
jgi:ribose transport system permease protein